VWLIQRVSSDPDFQREREDRPGFAEAPRLPGKGLDVQLARAGGLGNLERIEGGHALAARCEIDARPGAGNLLRRGGDRSGRKLRSY
jgi:hypothetical protein